MGKVALYWKGVLLDKTISFWQKCNTKVVAEVVIHKRRHARLET